MFFHRMVLGELVTNCYIAADEETGKACLFDAPAEANRILDYLGKKGLTLECIFLTHAHFDHILALDELKKATGAKIYANSADAAILNNPDWNLSYDRDVYIPHLECDAFAEDGDVISSPCGDIRVIHTPGHTKGCVCYLLGDKLITGDTLFKGAVGHTAGLGGNIDEELASVKNKLMVLDDDIKIYPGHGFSTTVGAERKENPFLI